MPAPSQRGRPQGVGQSTIVRAREASARVDALCPPMTATAAIAQVAQEFGASSSSVWEWLRLAHTAPTIVEAGYVNVETAPKPKPRMSRRTMLDRAWMAMHLGPVFKLFDDVMCMAWLRVVLAICEFGDGARLEFSKPGHFHTLDQLARAIGRQESDLQAMIDQAVLLRGEDGAIEVPYFFGLRPREKPGGSFMPGPSGASRGLSARAGDPRQMHFPPTGLPHPRDADSGEIHAPAGGPTAPDSSIIQAVDSEKIGADLLESGTRGTEKTTTTKEESLPCSSSPLGTAGAEATPTGGIPSGENGSLDSSKNDSSKNDSGKNALERATLFAPRVAEAASYPLALALAEIPTIAEWFGFEGSDEALIEGTILRDRAAPGAKGVTNLRFFTRAIRLAAARARSAPSSTPPEPPERLEDTIAWLCDDPDNPGLVAPWGAMRPAVRSSAPGDWEMLRKMVLRGLDGDELVIGLPSEFIRDWVRDHHGERITALWRAAYPEARRVDFRVHARPGDG